MTTCEHKIYVGLNSTQAGTTFTTNDVLCIVSASFGGFTVTNTQGYWKGTREPSLIIELIGAKFELVKQVAQEIKTALQQDAVLITSSIIQETLI